MKKYNVVTFDVETKDGKDALNVLLNQSNQTPDTSKMFDTIEEARAFFKTLNTSVDKYQSSTTYYLHKCKAIEENEYEEDEDGNLEWIGGGDYIAIDFPEYNNKR